MGGMRARLRVDIGFFGEGLVEKRDWIYSFLIHNGHIEHS